MSPDTAAPPNHPTPPPTVDKYAGLVQLFAGLVVAQSHAQSVAKDSTNEFHRYKYASAEAIVEEARQALAHGQVGVITTTWEFVHDGNENAYGLTGRMHVDYLVFHSSGECLSATCSTPVIPEKGRPSDKAEATALTYNLGYFLRGLLLLPRCEADGPDTRNDSAPRPKAVAKESPRPPAAKNGSPAPAPIPQAPKEYQRLLDLFKEKFKSDRASSGAWLKAAGVQGWNSLLAMSREQLEAIEKKLRAHEPPSYETLRSAFFARAQEMGIPIGAAYHWAGKRFGFPWDEAKGRPSLSMAPLANVQECVNAMQALDASACVQIQNEWDFDREDAAAK